MDKRSWNDLLKRVTRRTGGRADSEDLLHTAFLRLERYRANHAVANPAGFLVRAAINIGIDIRRHERLRGNFDPTGFLENASPEPLQDEVLCARVRLERVRQGLTRLPTRTREIFLMHRLEGTKYHEIAAKLGISQSAVEKHIARAVLFLTEWTEGW